MVCVGRGSRPIKRWRNDRQRKKKARAKRKAEGQAVDPAMCKELPEPSRLESLLISNQIGSYATQLSQFSAQGCLFYKSPSPRDLAT